MRPMKFLRNVSHVSAAAVAMHVALFAIYYSVGQFIFIGSPNGYANTGRLLAFTGITAVAIFCLSTQFYLRAKNG